MGIQFFKLSSLLCEFTSDQFDYSSDIGNAGNVLVGSSYWRTYNEHNLFIAVFQRIMQAEQECILIVKIKIVPQHHSIHRCPQQRIRQCQARNACAR
ncbi:hypothetical protein COO09_08700 [Rhizorhabdus dicambivorans]|uniref:Uncharacterized protein n=1 Tax=Rhizorhabdus dicambivorans TaxID=1850238 RepID=A0A2A4FXF3_9SPHN|nr:hypothetical protein CMV14_04565 [Rhizorhabdus dicambivorans]PCE42888.1 hypothetical protein COO09_08700 [Rhizorhabdus dicambivorans]